MLIFDILFGASIFIFTKLVIFVCFIVFCLLFFYTCPKKLVKKVFAFIINNFLFNHAIIFLNMAFILQSLLGIYFTNSFFDIMHVRNGYQYSLFFTFVALVCFAYKIYYKTDKLHMSFTLLKDLLYNYITKN